MAVCTRWTFSSKDAKSFFNIFVFRGILQSGFSHDSGNKFKHTISLPLVS